MSDWLKSNTLMIDYAGEDVELWEHSSIAGGNANLYKHFRNQYGGFSENWESTYVKTQKHQSWAYTQGCSTILQGHLFNYIQSRIFVIAKTWKQLRCPSTKQWIKKMWYTMELLIRVKNNDILIFACKWVDLENPILSEETQTQKDERGIYSLKSWH